MSTYHFITRWKMDASCEEVYRVLEDVDGLARWWPSVYLDVQEIEKGMPGGVGKVVELYTKGWLPYTLRWMFRVTATDFPKRFSLEAIGDFVGNGVWTFNPTIDSRCEVIYDWKITVEKPLLKLFTPILRPIFSANHLWAMRMGEKSLKLELQRRHAANESDMALIPAPPKPTFPHNLMNNKVLQNTPKVLINS